MVECKHRPPPNEDPDGCILGEGAFGMVIK